MQKATNLPKVLCRLIIHIQHFSLLLHVRTIISSTYVIVVYLLDKWLGVYVTSQLLRKVNFGMHSRVLPLYMLLKKTVSVKLNFI